VRRMIVTGHHQQRAMVLVRGGGQRAG